MSKVLAKRIALMNRRLHLDILNILLELHNLKLSLAIVSSYLLPCHLTF